MPHHDRTQSEIEEMETALECQRDYLARKPTLRGITPHHLANELAWRIAEICECTGLWTQHPHPLTYAELKRVREDVNDILEAHMAFAESDEAHR